MTIINSQWLHFQNLSRCVCVCVCVCVGGGGGGGGGGGNSKVVSYKYEATPHAVALYHPGNFFNTESGSVDEAWMIRRTCIVLDWIALTYT